MFQIKTSLTKLTLHPLYSAHSPSGQFGHVTDAVSLLQKANHIPILFPHFIF